VRPRITVLTLGVDDLERSLAFYRDGLGFPTEGIVGREFEHGAVVFIELQAGLKLALFARKDLARDANVPQGPPSPTEFSIGHNVGNRDEVDAVVAQAARAGAVVTAAPHETFWGGYAGYFQDPDGHLWEVVWNPAWRVEE
jgi:catechol 2,3-dioxygenase-like lactoylglutathione lyase family enzyme